jgi:hypothetical protein
MLHAGAVHVGLSTSASEDRYLLLCKQLGLAQRRSNSRAGSDIAHVRQEYCDWKPRFWKAPDRKEAGKLDNSQFSPLDYGDDEAGRLWAGCARFRLLFQNLGFQSQPTHVCAQSILCSKFDVREDAAA